MSLTTIGPDTAFENIPIIDISDARSTDTSKRYALAMEIRKACMEVGFFYVKGHGISQLIIDNAVSELHNFFSLPLEYKMKLENKKSPNFKGYSPLLSGNNDPNNKGDLQEGFEFGWEDPQLSVDAAREVDGVMAGANAWPHEDLPSFRPASLAYYHAAVDVGKSLFPLFALALDLSEDFFDDKTRHSAALMRMLHYPPQPPTEGDRVIGIGAHTDWECFTILLQEPGKMALQVQNTKQQWIDAPPIDGTLVINLGDQFARWTNDVFKSTVHRAINKSGKERYSIPLFFGTDYHVRLEPIASCVSTDRPSRYEVVTAGEYVKSRLAATYGHY
ncbi:iron/ascorbate-dependent oxidoreductase family protein [Pleurotus pulmonarius]